MAYFSNGTEGAMYEDEYCSKCLHGKGKLCAVLDAHYRRNYDECNNDDSILHLLIPREGVVNEKCRMFIGSKLSTNQKR